MPLAMTLRVESLTIYPVKGARGTSVERAEVDARGFVGDRRWMVVDPSGRFVTQREVPALALVVPTIEPNGLSLTLPSPDSYSVSHPAEDAQRREVQVWRDHLLARDAGDGVAEFLSDHLERSVRLVWMDDDVVRPVEVREGTAGQQVSFADGFPFLVVTSASLDELNRRLDVPVPMDRFRPNLVIAGAEPDAEDTWYRYRIGTVTFTHVKPCGRCVVTTTNQQSLVRSAEPLRTLATYRKLGREVVFGQNAVHEGRGVVGVGDAVDVLEGRAAIPA